MKQSLVSWGMLAGFLGVAGFIGVASVLQPAWGQDLDSHWNKQQERSPIMVAATSAASECAAGAKAYQQGAYEKAFAHFNRALKMGSELETAEANFWLYRCYYNGKGVRADSAQAIRYLKRAAQGKYAPACVALAKYYETNVFPDIGNSGGRFRGESTIDGLPRDGQVYYDSRSNGARGWSGRETQLAIAAEWYARAGAHTICPDCATGHDLANFQKAISYFNQAVAIYPWMSDEREDIAKQLQGALRGERIWHEGVEHYRFVDAQEMRDSRIMQGEIIWVMGIVEPRSSDGTGFYMRIKDTDLGRPVEIYVKLDTVKIKPRLGATMVNGRYTPASAKYGTPVTLYEVEEIRDMTPAGNGEVWYRR